MKKILITLIFMLQAGAALAEAQSKTTEALAFFLNACWQGQFVGSEDTDVHCFRDMVNSHFVRDNHLVNSSRGTYGGETVFWWDDEQQRINYSYWDSHGGMSTGTMQKTETGFVSPDETYEGRNGEKIVVRTRWNIVSEDEYIMESLKVNNGETSRMFAIEYKRAPLQPCPGPGCKY